MSSISAAIQRLTVCVWGGLASGQIYDSYQRSSSLMKCFVGAFHKMGSGGSSPVTTMLRVKSLGVCASVCPGRLLAGKLPFGARLGPQCVRKGLVNRGRQSCTL